MNTYTINARGNWRLLCQLRKIVNAEIAKKLNHEVKWCGGLEKSPCLQSYANEVTEAYQRGMDRGESTECEIGQFETKSRNPEFISLGDDCFHCEVTA